MASIKRTEHGRWKVRWRDPDKRARSRTVDSHTAALALKREVEECTGLGRRWDPQDAHPIPIFVGMQDGEPCGLASDYVKAHRGVFTSETLRHYSRALLRFAHFLKRENPRCRRLTIDMLTRDALQRWFGELRDTRGLAISTARLQVGAVQQAWEWGFNSDKYGPHTPHPRKIKMPAPSYMPARAPSWEQMDACITLATQWRDDARHPRDRQAWEWRRQMMWWLRCTGLRRDQVLALTWEMIDMGAGELFLDGSLGKSRAEQSGRIVPLAPVLLEEIGKWGKREGYLVGGWRTFRTSPPAHLNRLWEATGAPDRIWGPPPGRTHGRPHHAFRKGFKTGLVSLGVDPEVRDYLVGHHRGVNFHYEDLAEPAREAVSKIPDVGSLKLPVRLFGRS